MRIEANERYLTFMVKTTEQLLGVCFIGKSLEDKARFVKEHLDARKKATEALFVDTYRFWHEINLMREFFPYLRILDNELILDEEANLFFTLSDVNNRFDLSAQIIAWLSRSVVKSQNNTARHHLMERFNQYYNRQFSYDDFHLMYLYFGNDINRPLCINFIKSGMDIHSLKEQG